MLSRRPYLALVLAVAALGALATIGGYLAGRESAEQADWHHATVDLAGVAVDDDGPHLVSIESDGWTYAIHDGVAWVDARGSHHEDGWPDCLHPSRAGHSEEVTVRFASVVVDTGVVAWRPVVMVDCQGAG